ncbi:MAG TPA: hypothetical protein VD928_01305 [Candidatus Paceibacterota bacterium]|nr:hypothetical protein [Candidatus Paceibacterota bacterium]
MKKKNASDKVPETIIVCRLLEAIIDLSREREPRRDNNESVTK